MDEESDYAIGASFLDVIEVQAELMLALFAEGSLSPRTGNTVGTARMMASSWKAISGRFPGCARHSVSMQRLEEITARKRT